MFCTNCGKELKEGSVFCVHCGARVGEEPEGSAGERRTESGIGQNMEGSGSADKSTGIRQIIGKNADCYTGQFEKIHREGRSKINWASLFFGLLHAGYCGIWREWVKKVTLPLSIEFGCMLLMAILLFAQPAVAVVFAVVGFAANIWLLVVQVLFSRKFNQIYMKHIEQKLEQNDLRADPSVIRLVIAGVISAAVTTVLEILIMAATMGGMLGGLMSMGGQSDIDSLDIDWSSYMEDMDVDDYGILEDEAVENNLTKEDEILEDSLRGNSEAAKEETQGDYRQGESDYALWEDSYQRCYGPAAYIQLLSVDENGILFTASIGVSGYAAYVDMREWHAEWTDDYTAVYTESISDYIIQITLNEDGSISIYDTELSYEGLQLAGNYTKESEAVFPDCEYVFPHSSYADLMLRECEGMNELECKIARNEIYARHGRGFSDESLQAYFDSCSWYEGFIEPSDFSENMLSETEKENIRTINEYESMMGFR